MKHKTKINIQPKWEKLNEHVSQTANYSFMDLLTFAQCLGLFPVDNIRGEVRTLKFKWLSFKTLYSVLLLAVFLLITVLASYKAFTHEMVLYHLVSPLSYLHITATMILFLKMSTQWRKLVMKASVLDESFVKRNKCRTNLRKKINLIIVVVFITATRATGVDIPREKDIIANTRHGHIYFFWKKSSRTRILPSSSLPKYFHTLGTYIFVRRILNKWFERYRYRWSVFSYVEHCLATANFIFTNNCENDSIGLEYYFKKQFHYIFDYIVYNTFLGTLLLIASWIGTYIWTFGDVFIVATCVVLTTRFEQINAKIVFYIKSICCSDRKFFQIYSKEIQDMEVKFWREIREDYNIISQFCGKMNALLSDIILLNYASNLSFILFQLFVGYRQREKLVEMMYFYFSFGYVVLKTVLLCIYGGWLYEASKAPLPILNAVPTEIYNTEISRLIQQIHSDAPCLTGHNYFSVTKGLVLSVAAAVITYELVLIQFDQVTPQIQVSNQSTCF